MRSNTVLGWAFLSLCCATTPLLRAQTAQISLGPQAVQPDGTITAQVLLASQGLQIAGIQFDLTFDNTVNTLTSSGDSSANSSFKTLNSAPLPGPGLRVVVVGGPPASNLNANTIPDGVLVDLVVVPSSSGFSGILNLINPVATDPSGSTVAISDPAAPPPPVSSLSVVNGAIACLAWATPCGTAGPLAPGEIVSLFQTGMLPSAVSALDTTDVSVTFNGVSAPLLYTGPNQINAVTPFALGGQTSASVSVAYQGQTVSQATAKVAASAPGIFTVGSSGTGQAFVINQDGSTNSASNPAPIGSTVTFFATGAGTFKNPGLTDGEIIQVGDTSIPSLAVQVALGGREIDLTVPGSYVGTSPKSIAGVLQVNFVIGSNVPSGSADELGLFIGGVGGLRSPFGVTMAVK